MFLPKSLASQSRGPSLALLAALSIGLVLNLGALLFSLLILTRGPREYSALYPPPSPYMHTHD